MKISVSKNRRFRKTVFTACLSPLNEVKNPGRGEKRFVNGSKTCFDKIKSANLRERGFLVYKYRFI